MDDIVTRLRMWGGDPTAWHSDPARRIEDGVPQDMLHEAAAEIIQLRAENADLRDCLGAGMTVDELRAAVKAWQTPARTDDVLVSDHQAYKAARGAVTAPPGSPDSVARIRQVRDAYALPPCNEWMYPMFAKTNLHLCDQCNGEKWEHDYEWVPALQPFGGSYRPWPEELIVHWYHEADLIGVDRYEHLMATLDAKGAPDA